MAAAVESGRRQPTNGVWHNAWMGAMRLYYGWVIVAVGIVVSCIGVGTMM